MTDPNRQALGNRLKALVRDIPDFPHEGIMFRDITTLLADGGAFREAIDGMADGYEDIDKVVIIESRGFILGTPIAYVLGAGVVGMTLYRITLTPGTEIPEHDHSGAVTWYVDSGTLGLTVISGEVWVRCAADCVPGATPDATGFVLVSEGDEVMLEAGDWMIQHGTVAHAYRNAGEGDEAGNVVINASTTYLNLMRSCGGGCF
jgi:quercetin dioxygenase-like cupin family protein